MGDNAPEPFVIDPNALYSVEWLRERLHGLVELPTFLERLGLRERRVFRDAVWGWEIIEASRKAVSFNEAGQVDPAAVVDFMTRPMKRRSSKGTERLSGAGRLSAKDLRD